MAHSTVEVCVTEKGKLGFELVECGSGALVHEVQKGGLVDIASQGALHVGLELRGINGKRVRGHAVSEVLSHVAGARPLTLRFVNVYGDAEPGKDGLLRVTISAPVPLGVSFDEGLDGKVCLAEVSDGSAAYAASGGQLRRGMVLVEIDGVPIPSLDSALAQLSKGKRPTTLALRGNTADGRDSADVTVLAVESGAPG